MTIDIQALLDASRCYRCIPAGSMREVQIGILSRVIGCITPEPTPIPPTPPEAPFSWAPEGVAALWIDSNGAHNDTYPVFNAIADRNSVTSIDINESGVTGINNLSSLPALVSFDCSLNALTSLNACNCFHLITLYCQDNPAMSSLLLSGSTSLQTLICSADALTSLDVTGLTALTTLDCNTNAITPSITGLSTCTALVTLNVNGNPLTGTLNVAALTNMTDLNCGNCTQITGLNIVGLSNLGSVISGNCLLLPTVDFTGCTGMYDFDFSGCTNLASFTGTASLTNFVHIGVNDMTASGCAFTSLSFPNLLAVGGIMSYFNCANLASVSIPVYQFNGGSPQEADFDGCNLNQVSVDHILHRAAVTIPFPSNLTLNLAGGTNASPTGGALNPDYVALNADPLNSISIN